MFKKPKDYFRVCKKCDEEYKTKEKFSKVCEECKSNSSNKIWKARIRSLRKLIPVNRDHQKVYKEC